MAELTEVADVKPKKPGDKTPLLSAVNSDIDDYGSEVDEVSLRKDPLPEHTPGFVYVLTLFASIGGFLFGYDTGVVSGAMLLITEVFNLSSLWQEVIVSVTIGVAACFAIIGGFMNDRLGRKPTVLFGCCVFTIGGVVLGAAQNTTMLVLGRTILGIGIGISSMTVPMYLAETAPSHMRGRITMTNQLAITFGMFMAGIIDGLFSYDRKNGWRFMLGLAAVPAVLQFIGFWYMPESPRWLISKGRKEEARAVLKKIRGYDQVEEELGGIVLSFQESTVELEQRSVGGPIICQMLRNPSVRRALMVGCGLQIFQQLAGINTVMYYSATILKLSGIRDPSVAIWLAAVTAGVNFIFTFVGIWLVERKGRRSLLLGSTTGVLCALLVLALGFQFAAYFSPAITYQDMGVSNNPCTTYSNCDGCISSFGQCGFCYLDTPSGAANGSCLPRSSVFHQSAIGRCNTSATTSKDLVWAPDFCPTKYSWITMFGLVVYLASFSPGMGPMPWTINSEIYPLWARSTGNAVATSCNWIFNLLISMTFLSLTEALTKYGAFYLYSGFTFIGLVYLAITLPETKGKTLEQVQELFDKPFACPKLRST
ncbi:unnamed protein product [Owenia fusiformis]|uniref:Major facilitator superfamily (MFS) profile domain-containing protein n=1 Tax=Owenia fusiformis TaxID=6347 RepID=A0A8S4NM45_OWEFU|nr:unnamed protein product [Owenia fusiformis]